MHRHGHIVQRLLALGALTAASMPCVLTAEASAQSPSIKSTERDPPDGLGYCIARLNDVDGDGCADLAINDGSSHAWVISGADGKAIAHDATSAGGLTTLGGDVDGDGAWDLVRRRHRPESSVAIVSGKDLHLIRSMSLPANGPSMLGDAIGVGDWNGDGRPDVAVSLTSTPAGGLVILSGASGEVLREIKGEGELRLGSRFACDDIDHDGHADLVLGAHPWQTSAAQEQVRVSLTGKADSALVLPNCTEDDGFGAGLAVVPDCDGDGRSDVLVVHAIRWVRDEWETFSAAERKAALGGAGVAVVYSSHSGNRIRTLETSYADAMCETVTVANLEDLDQDGTPEFAVSYDLWWDFGRAVVYSGKTGAALREHAGVQGKGPRSTLFNPGRFAVCVVALGDTDRDGVGDYAIGASGGIDGMGAGCVSTYSGKSGALLRALWKRDLATK